MAGRQTKKDTSKEVAVVEFPVEEVQIPKEEVVTPAPKKKRRIADMDLNELISVESRVYGELHYHSREGYTCSWNGFGDIQPMPLSELLKMRNQAPRFFQDKWISFPNTDGDTEKVIDFLQVGKYYNGMVEVEDIEAMLLRSLGEVEEILNKADDTLLDSISRCAFRMYEEGTLYDMRVIDVIQKATGVTIVGSGDE